MALVRFRRIAAFGNHTNGVVTQATLGPHRAAVHVARGGPLYRASAQARGAPPRATPSSRARRGTSRPAPRPEPPAMHDSSADALLRALNRAYKRRPVLGIVLGAILALALVEGLALGAGVAATVLFGSLALVAVVIVGRREVEHYSEAVEYVLDDHVTHAYRRLVAGFNRLRAAGPVWHLGRRTADGGRRRRRRLIVPQLALPPRVRCNIRVPALRAGRQTLYFFPDRLLVYEPQMAWGVAYRDLKVKAGDVRDVAELGIGSADGANGFLALASDSGLSALFRCADAKSANEVAAALEALA